MAKPNKNIPLNPMADEPGQGIAIDRMVIGSADLKGVAQHQDAGESHRDEGHTFHIVEKGSLTIEIDFQQYEITAPCAVYMHPDQVHRILAFKEITVGSLAIKSEDLNPEYLELLEAMVPAQPLALTMETNTTVNTLFSWCINFSKQTDNRLYYPLLRDSCNTLVAFLVSQFISQPRTSSHVSRYDTIARSFKKLLEQNFRTVKRPGAYAGMLNISTPYLNECIKQATGLSVSENIQNRIILAAKRLLYHTDKSVKEIAFELGYEDYPYFSKLFSRAVGMPALAFRSKNLD